MSSKKQTYRIKRRCRLGAYGDEVQLSAEHAQAIDNETPGALELIEQDEQVSPVFRAAKKDNEAS